MHCFAAVQWCLFLVGKPAFLSYSLIVVTPYLDPVGERERLRDEPKERLRERLVRFVRNVFRRVSVDSLACFHIVPNQFHLPQLTAFKAIRY